MKSLSSRSGFTLVELLVIGAIVAILSVGFGAFMFQQTRQLKNTETSGDVKQLSMNIMNSASKREVLLNTEAISIANLPTPNTNCIDPCVWNPDMGQCVYVLAQNVDPRDATSMQCTAPANLPPGCTNVCMSGGSGGNTTGGNTGSGSSTGVAE